MLRFVIIALVLFTAAKASVEVESHKVTKAPLTDEQKAALEARVKFQASQISTEAKLARSKDGLLLVSYSKDKAGLLVRVKNLTKDTKTFDSAKLIGHAAGNEYAAGAVTGIVIAPGAMVSVPVSFIGRGDGIVAITWQDSPAWLGIDGKLYASAADAQTVQNERYAYWRAVQNANKLYKVSEGTVVQK